MGDELATLAEKIKKTEVKVEKIEKHIANNDFAGTPYDDRAEAKAALKDLEADLRAQEADLRRLLILDKEKEARLQQQSGAGTAMLPVHQELVKFPCQSSCCMHQQTLWLSDCMSVCKRF
jgi:DNA repair exonuclease SbcCD ATPase subunit